MKWNIPFASKSVHFEEDSEVFFPFFCHLKLYILGVSLDCLFEGIIKFSLFLSILRGFVMFFDIKLISKVFYLKLSCFANLLEN